MTDPLRPMFVPNPNDVSAGIAEGQTPAFLSCHYVMTDDGHSAIVEYVASTRGALQPVLDAAAAGTVSVFEPRSSSAAAMLQQLRQIKAGFTLRELRGGKLPRFSSLTQQNGGSN